MPGCTKFGVPHAKSLASGKGWHGTLCAKPVSHGARAGHWGLPGMRERAKSFGGKLEVWSEHGAGTEIELSVPGAIAYGKFDVPRRFWLWRKKSQEPNG